MFACEGFDRINKGHSHVFTQESDVIAALVLAETKPRTTLTWTVILDVQAIVILPHILSADFF